MRPPLCMLLALVLAAPALGWAAEDETWGAAKGRRLKLGQADTAVKGSNDGRLKGGRMMLQDTQVNQSVPDDADARAKEAWQEYKDAVPNLEVDDAVARAQLAWQALKASIQEANLHLKSAYEILSQQSNVVAVHMVTVPGTNRVLMMERPSGYHPDSSRNIAGTFDLITKEWFHLDSPDGLFCCGHSVTSDGQVFVVGGHRDNAGWSSGLKSLRLFNDGMHALDKIAVMPYGRWYPSVTLLPNKKMLIMGGTQGVGAGTTPNTYYEIWDQQKPNTTQQHPVDPTLLSKIQQNYYPFNYVLPTGDLFNFCARYGTIMEPNTANYLTDVPKRGGYSGAQFPFTGTSVLLALLPENNYEVEVMVFGGANEDATKDVNKIAGSKSHRLTVTLPTDKVPQYTFGDGWSEEEMGSARVMGDATLLPNGNIILLNGAQVGVAGDSASGGESRANRPNLVALQYNPYHPKGVRYAELARSQIPRMYHSTAVLTMNGTILVAGCDRCNPYLIQSEWEFLPSESKAEYRMEIFYPPAWYDFENKPRIFSSPGNVTFGETFMVGYTGEQGDYGQVTRAVLVAPSSTTHSFNMNQRVVGLAVESNDELSQIVTLKAPPTANIAPSQMYMLFLLNGDTYSRAAWIHLK